MEDGGDRAREVKEALFRERVLRARQTPPEEKLLDGGRPAGGGVAARAD